MSDLASFIPSPLLDRPGSAFLSGRSAFRTKGSAYLLGLNPGGDPKEQNPETVGTNVWRWREEYEQNWCSILDDAWNGRGPGEDTLQKRLVHLLNNMGFDPRDVAASNLVFERSRRVGNITSDRWKTLIDECWPFHRNVIREIEPKCIICYGKEAGRILRTRLNATVQVSEPFVEQNQRRWRSEAWRGSRGPIVFVLSHASVANWRAVPTDPSTWAFNILGKSVG